MYTLLWKPEGVTRKVNTWTDVITYLSTLTVPPKSISLVTSKTKQNCEVGPERLLVLLNETGGVTNTLYVSYCAEPKVQALQP